MSRGEKHYRKVINGVFIRQRLAFKLALAKQKMGFFVLFGFRHWVTIFIKMHRASVYILTITKVYLKIGCSGVGWWGDVLKNILRCYAKSKRAVKKDHLLASLKTINVSEEAHNPRIAFGDSDIVCLLAHVVGPRLSSVGHRALGWRRQQATVTG